MVFATVLSPFYHELISYFTKIESTGILTWRVRLCLCFEEHSSTICSRPAESLKQRQTLRIFA